MLLDHYHYHYHYHLQARHAQAAQDDAANAQEYAHEASEALLARLESVVTLTDTAGPLVALQVQDSAAVTSGEVMKLARRLSRGATSDSMPRAEREATFIAASTLLDRLEIEVLAAKDAVFKAEAEHGAAAQKLHVLRSANANASATLSFGARVHARTPQHPPAVADALDAASRAVDAATAQLARGVDGWLRDAAGAQARLGEAEERVMAAEESVDAHRLEQLRSAQLRKQLVARLDALRVRHRKASDAVAELGGDGGGGRGAVLMGLLGSTDEALERAEQELSHNLNVNLELGAAAMVKSSSLPTLSDLEEGVAQEERALAQAIADREARQLEMRKMEALLPEVCRSWLQRTVLVGRCFFLFQQLPNKYFHPIASNHPPCPSPPPPTLTLAS